MIRLGLNIDHVATLRQLRAGLVDYPDIIEAAKICMKSGADQITIHLRGDRRHIQEVDLKKLSELKMPLNLEMAATTEMLEYALKYKPKIVCLVPEKRQELTTEGGLDVKGQQKKLKKVVDALKSNKINVSLFIEAEEEQVKSSAFLKADAIELHTGKYALARTSQEVSQELKRLEKNCILAKKHGLKVHAGHGLNYKNVKPICKLPYIEELNIGHAVVCEAVMTGLSSAVSKMKKLINETK